MTEQHDEPVALKPCPFCGGEAKIVAPLGYGNVRAGECGNSDNCAATGPWSSNEAEAIAAWNTRPTPSAPDAMVEAMAVWKRADEAGELAYATAAEAGSAEAGCYYAGNQAAATVIAEAMAGQAAELAELRAEIEALRGALNTCPARTSMHGCPRAALGSAEG